MTLLQIQTAIIEKIKKEWVGTEFESVPITSEDTAEGSVRPSIKIAVDKLKATKFNSSCREKTFTVTIYFFAKDIYKCRTDMSNIQELLENVLLEDIYVENLYVPISNLNLEIKDGTLKTSFELYVMELLPNNEASETMESLEFKEEIND